MTGWADGGGEPRGGRRAPGRRSVLRAGLGAGLLVATGAPLLAGCSSTPSAVVVTPPPTPTPDEVLRRRALAQVDLLLLGVVRLGADPSLRGVTGTLTQNLQAQRTALGAPAQPSATGTDLPTTPATPATPPTPPTPPSLPAGSVGPTGTTDTATPSGSSAPAGPSGSPAPVGPTATGSTPAAPVPGTPMELLSAWVGAATQALTDCAAAGSAGLAVLLARLAGAHAAACDLVAAAIGQPPPGPVLPVAAPTGAPTGTTSPGPSGTSTATAGTQASVTESSPAGPLAPAVADALSKLLQGEHAAVYAYGAITAWVAVPLRGQARADWQAHAVRRDELVGLLSGAGATPAPASAGYDLGTPPADSSGAVALAAKVEDRLAALAASAVGAGPGPSRQLAAEILVDAARRGAGWSRTVAALPGTAS